MYPSLPQKKPIDNNHKVHKMAGFVSRKHFLSRSFFENLPCLFFLPQMKRTCLVKYTATKSGPKSELLLSLLRARGVKYNRLIFVTLLSASMFFLYYIAFQEGEKAKMSWKTWNSPSWWSKENSITDTKFKFCEGKTYWIPVKSFYRLINKRWRYSAPLTFCLVAKCVKRPRDQTGNGRHYSLNEGTSG